MTNFHVIRGASNIKVALIDSSVFPARVRRALCCLGVFAGAHFPSYNTPANPARVWRRRKELTDCSHLHLYRWPLESTALWWVIWGPRM